MTRRIRPSFIGIGFRRCGTSWLNRILFEHPQIGKPTSGLHFFTQYFDRGADWYEMTLADLDGGTGVVGEFSTTYSYPDVAARVADRIYDLYPEVKLIASIRNPVDRCHSDYWHMLRHGEISETDITFDEVLARYPEIVQRSRYALILSEFYKRFPAGNIHMIRYEDIVYDPISVVSRLYAFLDTDAAYVPESVSERLGATYAMRSTRLERTVRLTQAIGSRCVDLLPESCIWPVRNLGRRIVSSIRRGNTAASDARDTVQTSLGDEFDDDIQMTMKLTGLDLSDWVQR